MIFSSKAEIEFWALEVCRASGKFKGSMALLSSDWVQGFVADNQIRIQR